MASREITREELWEAFEPLTEIAARDSGGSMVARDLLVYSHNRSSFDIAQLHRLDGRNTDAAWVVIIHAANGQNDLELSKYLTEKDLCDTPWLDGRISISGHTPLSQRPR